MSNEIEFINESDIFKFKDFKELRSYATAGKRPLNLSSIKTSSFVSSVNVKKDSIQIIPNKKRRVSCGLTHKIMSVIKKANPNMQVLLSDELINMEEDEKLVYKSRNPLWVLKEIGDTLSLKRIFN